MNMLRFILTLFVTCFASCTLSQNDPTGLIPMREAPQPGFTKLSEHFGVEVNGGIFNVRTIRYFHIEKRKRELIGSALFPVYSSRQGAYAISADGMTLLFMNDERSNDLPIDTGLYEFIHPQGVQLVDSYARSGIYINDNLSEQEIVFKRLQSTIIRDTDGNERIWEFPKQRTSPQKESSSNPWP